MVHDMNNTTGTNTLATTNLPCVHHNSLHLRLSCLAAPLPVLLYLFPDLHDRTSDCTADCTTDCTACCTAPCCPCVCTDFTAPLHVLLYLLSDGMTVPPTVLLTVPHCTAHDRRRRTRTWPRCRLR